MVRPTLSRAQQGGPEEIAAGEVQAPAELVGGGLAGAAARRLGQRRKVDPEKRRRALHCGQLLPPARFAREKTEPQRIVTLEQARHGLLHPDRVQLPAALQHDRTAGEMGRGGLPLQEPELGGGQGELPRHRLSIASVSGTGPAVPASPAIV